MKLFNLLAISLFIVAAAAQAAPLAKLRVDIQNPTSGLLRYTYRMGGDDWQKHTIKPGFTQTLNGIANHYIRYDNGRGKTVQYTINKSGTYYFRWSQKTLFFMQH